VRRRTLVAVAAAGAITALLAACGKDAAEPSGSSPTSSSTSTSTSAAATGTTTPPKLKLTPIGVVGAATAATTRAGDGDLYVTEQRGIVRRVRLEKGTASIDPSPVLDISGLVTAAGEQGLLGIAFSPQGDQLYLAFTNKDANQELDRFSFDGTKADRASRTTVITIPDFAVNHNGGDIVFGPDGYLWYGMGDGGGTGDPQHNGQRTTDLLGDLLRIDPLKPTNDKPYSIPSDNPFADGKNGAPEVYSYGLRNPWRFSFDRETNDLWIADVGQGQWEEIDKVTLDKAKGANFGWSQLEGSHPFSGGTAPAGAIPPVYEYDHSGGGCAVIGGYVYRGKQISGLTGTYLFSDNCIGQINGLRVTGDKGVAFDLQLTLKGISSFAQDHDGELYVLSVDGTIGRIDAA
jgi:glucose/arabinose dehydrogenase